MVNKHLANELFTRGPAVRQARLAVLAVHGRGQNPDFMFEQAERFDPSAVEGVRFYAPHASEGTWYPKPFMEPVEANEPNLTFALESMEERLAKIGADGFLPSETVVWGFSQGACLLAHLLLTRLRVLRGALLFTGGHIGAEPVTPPPGNRLGRMPVLMRSVDRDPWVPYERVKETAALLRRGGAAVDLRVDRGDEHIITDEAFDAASVMLADR